MRHVFPLRLIVLAVAVGTLAACAGYPGASSTYPSATTTYPAASPSAYAEYGRVTNVELLRTQPPSNPGVGGIGAGTVIGGVVGGVLGHQVGGGRGQDVATLAGVVGGALVGNAMEKGRTPPDVSEIYRVSVQLDGGSVRTFDYATRPDIRIGDRVRVENNQLYR